MADRSITEHNERQLEAIRHMDGPLLIIAGAGTGKTRVIVERIGHLQHAVPGLKPENIFALTFGEKAAAEMQARAAALFGDAASRCRFSTFHAFCYGLLANAARPNEPPKAVDKFDQWIFLRRHLEELDLDHYLRVSEPGRFLNDLLEFCSRCHDNLVTPEDFTRYVEQLTAPAEGSARDREEQTAPKRRGRKPALTTAREIARQRETARVYARSEALLETAGMITFGGMISRAVALLKDSPELLARLQRECRYLLVDEFQDTNWAQIELLRLLAGKSRNVTVVGDRKQAIYHFRGASRTSFDLFQQTFPEHRAVVLAQNYRSTKVILAVAETAISHARETDSSDEALTTANPAGRAVEVWQFTDETSQADAVAQAIVNEATSDARYSDFAVLYRAHRYRDLLVRALRRREVPFAIRNLSINNLPAVRDMVASLRTIGAPSDSVSLVRVMQMPRWGIGGKEIQALCHAARARHQPLREQIETAGSEERSPGVRRLLEWIERYKETARETRLAQWIAALRGELKLFDSAEEQNPWKTFAAFIAEWDKSKSSGGLLQEFLEYFDFFEEAGGAITLPDEEAGAVTAPAPGAGPATPAQRGLWDESPGAKGKVQLMTVHAAKGLEFDHVFVLHMLRGAFPSRRQEPLISFPDALLKGPPAQKDAHTEEERRLFYVALTRARKSLTLTTIENEKQKPSSFLLELRDASRGHLEWKLKPASAAAAPPAAPEATPTGSKEPVELVLSTSAIEAYLHCPRKYHYRYVLEIPEPPSAAVHFGSIMHAALRRVIQTLQNNPESISGDRIEAILREQWSEAGFTDALQERKYWESGMEQLTGLWKAQSARTFDLLYQEKTFEFYCGETKLVGRIDQLNRISGRNVELIEYKTGREQTQKDAERSLQLTIYGEACRRVLELEPARLVLYNLSSQEALESTRTTDDFHEMVQTIGEVSAGIKAGRFEPERNYRCRYCEFRAICPAHEEIS